MGVWECRGTFLRVIGIGTPAAWSNQLARPMTWLVELANSVWGLREREIVCEEIGMTALFGWCLITHSQCSDLKG